MKALAVIIITIFLVLKAVIVAVTELGQANDPPGEIYIQTPNDCHGKYEEQKILEAEEWEVNVQDLIRKSFENN